MNPHFLNFKGGVGKLTKILKEVVLPARCVVKVWSRVLEFVTDLMGTFLRSCVVQHHFHLLLSGMVLFGPLLSLWVSKHNIFANSHHYLYRKFLWSAWGWTLILTTSFILLLSLSAHRPLSRCLRHLSRLLVVGLLWWSLKHLLVVLEDAAGSCYEPMPQDSTDKSSDHPSFLLHENHGKASCLRARMQWRGYEVSQDVLILCICCLLILEEICVFKDHIMSEKSTKDLSFPLRLIFFLCALLLVLWMFLLLCLLAYFPQFPAQQLGGALGYMTWRGLYQGWFKVKGEKWSPGMPGEGLQTADNNQK